MARQREATAEVRQTFDHAKGLEQPVDVDHVGEDEEPGDGRQKRARSSNHCPYGTDADIYCGLWTVHGIMVMYKCFSIPRFADKQGSAANSRAETDMISPLFRTSSTAACISF